MTGSRAPRPGLPVLAHIASASILLGAAAFVIFGQTAIAANPHDFFLPINAAHAMKSGGFGQDTLRSPFGPLYFLLSGNSLALIEAFPEWIQLDKIHTISSLQVSAVTAGMFFAYRALQDDDRKLPAWVLMVALIVCFLPRSLDIIWYLYPDWYGTYNGHLWSILLIQAVNRLAWRGRRPASAKLLPLGLLEGLCLAISLHYKVSFFAASCLLAFLSFCCLDGWRHRLAYCAAVAAVIGCSFLALGVAGYSYLTYAGDLRWALEAKSLAPREVAIHLVFFAAFVVLSSALRPAGRPGQAGFFPAWAIRDEALREHALHASFSAIAASAFLIAALGDFNVPLWPYFVSLACAAHLYGYLSPSGWRAASLAVKAIVAGGILLLSVLLMSALVTLAIIITFPHASARPSPHHGGFRSMDADPLRFTYVEAGWDRSRDVLVTAGHFASSPFWERNVIGLSYQNFDSEDDPLMTSLQTLALARYTHDLNVTAQWIRRKKDVLSPASKVAIGQVSFVNPWPFLTGNPFPKGTLHWMHMYTTIGDHQLEAALEPLAEADAVVLPAISVTQNEQAFLNCAFYLWNSRRGGEFVPQALSGLNIVFLRRGGKLPPQEPALFDAASSEIKRACRG